MLYTWINTKPIYKFALAMFALGIAINLQPDLGTAGAMKIHFGINPHHFGATLIISAFYIPLSKNSKVQIFGIIPFILYTLITLYGILFGIYSIESTPTNISFAPFIIYGLVIDIAISTLRSELT